MKKNFMARIKFIVSMFIVLAMFSLVANSPTISAQTSDETTQNQEPAFILEQHEDTTQDQTQEDQSTTSEQGNILDSGHPEIQQSLCAGANLSVNSSCASSPDGSEASADEVLNDIVADIINLFSLVVGVVAVIMIIVGGFRYITSGGDSTNVGNAKNTIMYALIGLVIVALSQTIVRFVLGRVVIQ